MRIDPYLRRARCMALKRGQIEGGPRSEPGCPAPVAAGNTLGKTPSQSAYSSLQNHQLGNGITPPLRACMRARRPVRRDARVAIGAWRSALMDACSASNLRPLDWGILRYDTNSNGCAATVSQSQLIGLKCLVGVRSAETLSRSHDVRRQGPLSGFVLPSSSAN
jgi:hypothetical protein